MLKEKVKNDILSSITDADVRIFSNDNKHFNIVIIADIFKEKELLDRQKLMYDILGEYIVNKQIHAISFKTYTKTEWLEENVM